MRKQMTPELSFRRLNCLTLSLIKWVLLRVCLIILALFSTIYPNLDMYSFPGNWTTSEARWNTKERPRLGDSKQKNVNRSRGKNIPESPFPCRLLFFMRVNNAISQRRLFQFTNQILLFRSYQSHITILQSALFFDSRR